MARYVIIGGGVASIGCIEGIRTRDKDAEIVLISREGYAYCRPLISYYMEGKTDFDKMAYRSKEFYQDIELVRANADVIDAAARTVTAGGNKYDYDELCIATGSTPFTPPFEGLEDVEYKTSFMTEEDAKYLDGVISKDSRVLIIGAGLIGLKCAEGIVHRVKSVTVCDLADRVLSSILDKECADRMQKVLEENSVKFYLANSVKSFDTDCAVLNDGKVVEFDVLVTAVGVRANVSLVKGIVDIDRGILTDKSQRTSNGRIYAAGDCCQGYDASIDANKVVAIWPNAYMQGYTAGVNMAGGNETFDKGMPLNAIGFFGFHALTAGAYRGEMIETKDEKSLKRLFVEDNKLVGFMLIGEFENAGILTSLVRNKTPLDEVNFELLKISPSLVGLDAKKRKEILGGVV